MSKYLKKHESVNKKGPRHQTGQPDSPILSVNAPSFLLTYCTKLCIYESFIGIYLAVHVEKYYYIIYKFGISSESTYRD